jgi:hypothetical protein
MEKLELAINSEKISGELQKNLELASKINLNGVPVIIFNNQIYNGLLNEKDIDDLLNSKKIDEKDKDHSSCCEDHQKNPDLKSSEQDKAAHVDHEPDVESTPVTNGQ